MTEEEARKLLRGIEALVKAGRGICSRNTFDQIASVLRPEQWINEDPSLRGVTFCGIDLHISPYMEDGVIWPWPEMDVWGDPKYRDEY
jgi:hypothetical protein